MSADTEMLQFYRKILGTGSWMLLIWKSEDSMQSKLCLSLWNENFKSSSLSQWRWGREKTTFKFSRIFGLKVFLPGNPVPLLWRPSVSEQVRWPSTGDRHHGETSQVTSEASKLNIYVSHVRQYSAKPDSVFSDGPQNSSQSGQMGFPLSGTF